MKSLKACRKKRVYTRKRKPVIVPALLIKLLKLQHLILYIKADSQYIKVITADKVYEGIRFSMADVKPLLESSQFFFGHRSYYINLFHVKGFSNRCNGLKVLINNNDNAFVCPYYKDEFIKRFNHIKKILKLSDKTPDNFAALNS